MVGALVICLVLFAGLFHDFSLSDPSRGWFTSNPAIPIGVLILGDLLMVAQRFANRREE